MYSRLTSQVLPGEGRFSAKVALATDQSNTTTPRPMSGKAKAAIVRSKVDFVIASSGLHAVHRERGRVGFRRLGIERDTVEKRLRGVVRRAGVDSQLFQ